MGLNSIYREMIQEPKEETVLQFGINQTKPIMYDRILTPNDRIIQNPNLPYTLQVDEEGTQDFISVFQELTEQYPQLLQSTGTILKGIYHSTISFFGVNKKSRRSDAYSRTEKNEEGMITSKAGSLSNFKGNGSAACSEKATAVHNLLIVLCRNGNLQNYRPFLVLSKVDGGLHAFNLLRDEKHKKTLIFDTSYLVKDQSGKYWCGIYSVNETDYDRFTKGKIIRPQLITPGTKDVDNGNRQYGVEEDSKLQENDFEK